MGIARVTASAFVMIGLLAAGHDARAGVSTDPVVLNYRMGTATHFDMQSSRPFWNPEQLLPLIADAGLGYIRDGIGWGRTETVKGTYVISPQTLALLPLAHQYGLKVILCLNYGNKLYADPYDPDAYAKFCAEMARRLRGQVAAFEIQNEPANFGFSKAYGGNWNGMEKDGSVSPWIARYVELINKASAAIKAVDPTVKVIGLGAVPPANFRMLALGIAPTVDGIVDHPYSFRYPPEIVPFAASEGLLKRDGIAVADDRGTFASLIQKYRETSAKYNGPKEMWLTEWGFTTFQQQKPSLYAGYTENAQAKYMLRRFLECIALGIEVSFQYDFIDDGSDPHDPEDHFGLVDHHLRPKKSYEVVKRLARATVGLQIDPSTTVEVHPMADRADAYPITWDGSKLAAPGTIPTYAFRDPMGRRLVAIWSAERADGDLNPRLADVEIHASGAVGSIRSLDLFTGEYGIVRFESHDGVVQLKNFTVPDYPILLSLD